MVEKCEIKGEKIIDFITRQVFIDTDDERIRQRIEHLLIEEKGYLKEDIEVNREFEVAVDNEILRAKADLIVSVEGKSFMLISCARSSLVMREREILSCARIIDDYQIPFSVITDGRDAEVMDTISGEVVGSGLEAIPTRQQALETIKSIEFKKLPEKRIEKEKRIFLAFDTIKSECDN